MIKIRSKRLTTFLLTLLTGLMLLPAAVSAEKIVIAPKAFTEGYLLGELATQYLLHKGYEVEQAAGMVTQIIRTAIEQDQIDMYYEYTGTAYTVFFKQSDPEIMTSPKKVYEAIKSLDEKHNLVWLDPIQFNNTYSLIMRKEQADKLGIKTLDDLAQKVKEGNTELIFAVDAEFWERPDGFKKLVTTYKFRPRNSDVKKMTEGLIYKALREGQINVGMGYATDGRIAAFGFVNLEDNRQFFPVYNPAPVIRAEVLEQHPNLQADLMVLAAAIDDVSIQKMNSLVDIDKKPVSQVVENWLTEKGLIN